MKPRHAVALVLVGWYLMVPPMDNQGRNYATVPIKYWHLIRAFDSAKECEEFVEQFGAKARFRGEWYGVLKERTLSSRCVSTDDPRLEGNQDTPPFNLGHSSPDQDSTTGRLKDCGAALASDDGPIFSTVAKLVEALKCSIPEGTQNAERKKEALSLARELTPGNEVRRGMTEPREVELWPCGYNAECSVPWCRRRATTILRYLDAQERPYRQTDVCGSHARELCVGMRVIDRRRRSEQPEQLQRVVLADAPGARTVTQNQKEIEVRI